MSRRRALISSHCSAAGEVIASAAAILKACGIATASFRERRARRQKSELLPPISRWRISTGSLVFMSEPRLISLLPPRHIAVIERVKIISGLDELFSRVPYPGAESSAMVLVTGPSRTADIEMRLVRGVHGPGEILVLIVGDV